MNIRTNNRTPEPLLDAVNNGTDEDAEALLTLLFAPHMLIDDPQQEDGNWFDITPAFAVRRWYMENEIPPVIQKIAPTWEDAKRVAVEWLEACPHTCADYDEWNWNREILDDQSPKTYLINLLGLKPG